MVHGVRGENRFYFINCYIFDEKVIKKWINWTIIDLSEVS